MKKSSVSDPDQVGMAVQIRLKLNHNFSTFNSNLRTLFLKRFSEISGLPVDQIRHPAFRPGCVIFEALIDDDVGKKVLALLKLAKDLQGDAKVPEEMKIYLDFISEFNVQEVSGEAARLIRNRKRHLKRSIVLVHGWNGDSSSFGNLPVYLEDLTSIPSKVFDFPTGPLRHSPAIHFVAENLDNWIRINFSLADARLALVGHSMGGIVLRKLLSNQIFKDEPIDSIVRQVTFIASPHAGATIASLASKIPGLGSAQLREVSPASSDLVELKAPWEKWKSANRAISKHIRSIYGTADAIVSQTSASSDDPNAVPILGATHTDIVKPQSKESEIVMTLTRFIEAAQV